MRLYDYFLLFIIYSFFGWSMEVISIAIEKKKIINRGFLIGPYCPIYGWGFLIIYILLKGSINDPIKLFLSAIVICSLLEYFTSYFMEKIFHARWWDYSNKKFNINGRICLETMIPFGLIALFVMYMVNPFFISILNIIPNTIRIILSTILLIIFIIDNCVSFKVVGNIKSTIKKIEKDNTEEVSKNIREFLKNKSYFSKRLINAFPKFKAKFELLKERFDKK